MSINFVQNKSLFFPSSSLNWLCRGLDGVDCYKSKISSKLLDVLFFHQNSLKLIIKHSVSLIEGKINCNCKIKAIIFTTDHRGQDSFGTLKVNNVNFNHWLFRANSSFKRVSFSNYYSAHVQH